MSFSGSIEAVRI